MISIINSPHKCLSQLDGLSWLVSTRSTQEQANESAEFLLLVLNRPFFFQLFFQLFNFQRQAKIHRICRDWTLKRIAYQFTDRGETSKESEDNCSDKVAKFHSRLYGGGHELAPHHTNVCNIPRLRGMQISVSFQQITFKLGNFTD